MIKEKIKVQNKLGIHARPATLLAKVANKAKSNVKLAAKGKEVDAKSVLKLLTLALRYGDEIELIVDGEDEEQVVKEIKELFERKFDEE